MANKISEEQSNPLLELNNIITSIKEIDSIKAIAKSKIDNGLIVSLPNNELGYLFNLDSEDLPQYEQGNSINVILDKEGNIYNDYQDFDLYKKMLSKAQNGKVFIGKITAIVNKGVLVSIDGLQSFMPKIHLGTEYKEDLQSLVGKDIEVKVISIKLKEKEGNRFLPVVSHKVIEDEIIIDQSKDKLRDVRIGDILPGIVKRIEKYGVFVNLYPGIDGLIYITDLSWERVNNPADLVTIGQTINVMILDIKNEKNGKLNISLGLKQLQKRPWELFDKNSKVGDIVKGKICNITDYGIFVLLPCGVQGLVHRTELSWNNSVNPGDFQIDQEIEAKIINIDWENEKLLLSKKLFEYDPWVKIEEKYSVGDKVSVTITGFSKYLIYVELEFGVSGVIFKNEISWDEEIGKPKDRYSKGERIDVVILNLDKEKKQMELSHKRLYPNPWKLYGKGQQVNVIVVDKNEHGIWVKLLDNNIKSFISKKYIAQNFIYDINSILTCNIVEIDEDKKKITLKIE